MCSKWELSIQASQLFCKAKIILKLKKKFIEKRRNSGRKKKTLIRPTVFWLHASCRVHSEGAGSLRSEQCQKPQARLSHPPLPHCLAVRSLPYFFAVTLPRDSYFFLSQSHLIIIIIRLFVSLLPANLWPQDLTFILKEDITLVRANHTGFFTFFCLPLKPTSTKPPV